MFPQYFSPVADALQTTCQETGGLFIESSKVDVADIVALLSQSIKTSEVFFIVFVCTIESLYYFFLYCFK